MVKLQSIYLSAEKRRWFIIAIIFCAIVFNYVDRQIVSILKPILKEEFSIGNEGYAWIINVFTICYAIMYPVSGWLVDKFGVKRIMLYGILTWTIACIGGGLSRTLGQFTFFRGLLGIGEPSNFPVQVRIISTWIPDHMRATVNSMCIAGTSIGAIIAPPLIVWLTLNYSWHAAFIVPGIIGLIIAFLWVLIYREPPPHILKEATKTNVSAENRFTWLQLWKTKSLWGILLIRFFTDPVWYFCLFWLPGYLQESSGLSLAQVGMFGWIPFLFADLGAIGMSYCSDVMVRKGMSPLRSRKRILTIITLIAPLCIIIPYLSNAGYTIAIFSLIAIMCLTWIFNTGVVMSEIFPVKNVASVVGIAGGFGAVGAVLFNYLVGQLIGTLGADKIFLIMAFFHPLAVLILWTMIKKVRLNKENLIHNIKIEAK